ncbi:MAG: EAL domain-containing protein [Gammaproteobacteria bacterium]
MKPQPDFRELTCSNCTEGSLLDFDFSMALQPIIDVRTRTIFAHEALVRGLNGEGAAAVFQHVNDSNRYRFDQTCRVKAVRLASQLNLPGLLSINFMPNAIYRAELCIRTTLAAAEQYEFPVERILFEATEGERVDDADHMKEIFRHYNSRGFQTAIDDFGAGFAGLNLLAEFQPHLIKIDMGLVRNIHLDRARRAIVRGITVTCADLDIRIIAEGIECAEELQTLTDLGIELFQGYYFARPAFEALPDVHNL